MSKDQLNGMQRFFTVVLPHSWAAAMRADSLAWKVRCSCGFERSVWELGGIRWKSKGGKSPWLLRCPQCGGKSWHSVYRP